MRSAAPLALAGLVACHSTATTPESHRASDVACTPGAPLSASTDSGLCATVADCPAGAKVRCVAYDDAGARYCNDDACDLDTDCPGAGVCQCGTASAASTLATPNVCLSAGNCRIDADCAGSRPYCSSSSVGCGTSFAYFCHTPKDDCGNDSDCSEEQFCQYVPGAGKWECADGTGCN